LIFAQHAIVDEHASQALTQSVSDKSCGYGGIHAAGKSADGLALLAHGLTHLTDGLIDEMLWRPVRARAADVIDKVAQQVCAGFCVVHFRMKLDCPDAPR